MHYQPPGAELKLLPGPSQSYANLASHMGHAYGKSPVKTYEIHLHSSIKSQTYGYGWHMCINRKIKHVTTKPNWEIFIKSAQLSPRLMLVVQR